MKLSAATKLAGIMGWPVSQSLSPQLHGYWLEEMNIDGALVPLAVQPEDFSTAVSAFMKAGFVGVSVTLPHKQAAFAIAHSNDAASRIAGAANLLVFDSTGKIEGRNTDSGGFVASVRESLGADACRRQTVVVLGAGGAARAIALALDEIGASEIRIVNRSRDRADQLASALSTQISSKILAFHLEDWPQAAQNAALVVQATSAGMRQTAPLDIELKPLPNSAVICDIVYNPLETQFLKRARAAGFKTIDGLGMLMHQGVPAFQSFFGAKPKVTPQLRRTLEQALSRGR